jgi:hypothetical protein
VPRRLLFQRFDHAKPSSSIIGSVWCRGVNRRQLNEQASRSSASWRFRCHTMVSVRTTGQVHALEPRRPWADIDQGATSWISREPSARGDRHGDLSRRPEMSTTRRRRPNLMRNVRVFEIPARRDFPSANPARLTMRSIVLIVGRLLSHRRYTRSVGVWRGTPDPETLTRAASRNITPHPPVPGCGVRYRKRRTDGNAPPVQLLRAREPVGRSTWIRYISIVTGNENRPMHDMRRNLVVLY